MIEMLLVMVAYLLIAGVVWWGGNEIINRLQPVEPIRSVAYVLLVIVVCILVIMAILTLIPGHNLRLR